MKDWKPICSLLLCLILQSQLLVGHVSMDLEARIIATTDNKEGIYAEVDTLLMKKWKEGNLKYRFYRRLKGAKEFDLIGEGWGTYHVFDVTAPGLWYEYKVEVLENGVDSFFLSTTEPVWGYRPPSGTMKLQFEIVDFYKYQDTLYIDFDFLREDGTLIFSDSALYHIQYQMEKQKVWYESLGINETEEVKQSIDRKNSRIHLAIPPGMQDIKFYFLMHQKGKTSKFFNWKFDIRNVPIKKPGDPMALHKSGVKSKNVSVDQTAIAYRYGFLPEACKIIYGLPDHMAIAS